MLLLIFKMAPWGAWLSQSVERVTLDLWIVSSSPIVGVEITLKKKKP